MFVRDRGFLNINLYNEAHILYFLNRDKWCIYFSFIIRYSLDNVSNIYWTTCFISWNRSNFFQLSGPLKVRTKGRWPWNVESCNIWNLSIKLKQQNQRIPKMKTKCLQRKLLVWSYSSLSIGIRSVAGNSKTFLGDIFILIVRMTMSLEKFQILGRVPGDKMVVFNISVLEPRKMKSRIRNMDFSLFDQKHFRRSVYYSTYHFSGFQDWYIEKYQIPN